MWKREKLCLMCINAVMDNTRLKRPVRILEHAKAYGYDLPSHICEVNDECVCSCCMREELYIGDW